MIQSAASRLLIGLTVLLPVIAQAADWELKEVEISGAFSSDPATLFSDDFSDGLRLAPPTSALFDAFGNTTESGGALHFDSADGGFFVPPAGGFPGFLRDVATYFDPIVDVSSGSSTITAHFEPKLAEVAGGSPVDGYGIFQSSFAGGAFLSVFQDFLGAPAILYQTFTAAVIGYAPITSVTGDIVLKLTLDQTTDTVLPTYSVDGGSTFIPYSSWVFNSGELEIPVEYTPAFEGDFVGAGAFGQTVVPVPPAVYLFGSALGLLWARKRRRS